MSDPSPEPMPDEPAIPSDQPLKILHLEDSDADAALVQAQLEADGIHCDIHRVETKTAFESALLAESFDLILSDYSLPSFNGLAAFHLAHDLRPAIPFIFVSGTIGEDVAVDSLKAGAIDYVLKDRPNRFVPAVRRALDQAREAAARARIEESLRHREALFSQITENVDDLIAIHDLDGRWTYVSPSYRTLFEKPQELVGTSPLVHIHPDDQAAAARLFSDMIATGTSLMTELRFRDERGVYRPIEARGSAVRDRDGRVTSLVVVSRDMSQRHEAEQRIRQQAALLDAAQDAIFVRDLDGRVSFWNEGARRLYGWSAEEVTGRSMETVTNTRTSPTEAKAWEHCLLRGHWLGEASHTGKSGKSVTVMSRWTLLHAPNGLPTAVLTIDTDISEKKQIEAQFLRSQRLENIGALAGGIAHDLNNILSPVMMLTDVLRESLTDPESLHLLETVKASASRGASLVRQILSFARGVSGERVPLNAGYLARDMAKLARETFPKSITIETFAERELWLVIGDPTQIHQVLLNLCVNARDAMPKGGRIVIKLSNETLSDRTVAGLEKPVSGDFVILTVQDTGQGIPPEIREKIFEPFFTTKEAGKGTGLGLSTVASIVRNHGGFIHVRSELNQGTCFEIGLPATRIEAASRTETAPARPPVGSGELVLLVDDDRAVLEMTRETLEAFHYQVLVAGEGAEALAIFENNRGSIRLVVTDLQMPVMNGQVLAQELRARAPETPVIGISGATDEVPAGDEIRRTLTALIGKPYSTDQLLRAVHDALHKTAR